MRGAICLLFFATVFINLSHCSKEYTIHLVSHSHQDVGWLLRPEQYYNERSKAIEQTTLNELSEDQRKTFVEVEMYFIHRYFQLNATVTDKEKYKKLVESGQLEILSGGWVSSDDATTYYDDIINQYMFGHKFSYEQLGVIPKIVWHLDQFGHSAGVASILAQMGFNVLFFCRDNYIKKEENTKDKELQFVWNPYPNYKWDVNIFAHSYFQHYAPLHDLCFDSSTCWGTRFTPDYDKTYLHAITNFVEDSKQRNKGKVKDFLLLQGDDFNYQNAKVVFDATDHVINYINQQDVNFHIKYSTPSAYYQARLKTAKKENIQYSTFKEELFPYIDKKSSYWTGFYTSKPELKGHVRTSSKLYHAIQKLASLYSLHSDYKSMFEDWEKHIWTANDALAKGQHHDGATGTNTRAVGDYYSQQLTEGDRSISNIGRNIIQKMLRTTTRKDLKFLFCSSQYDNITDNSVIICPDIKEMANTNQSIIVSITNPSKYKRSIIRIPLRDSGGGFIEVVDTNGEKVESEILCQPNIGNIESCILYMEASLSTLEVSFFILKYSQKNINIYSSDDDTSSYRVGNKYQELEYLGGINWDYCGIKEAGIQSKSNICEPTILEIDYKYYSSYTKGGQHSGHYIFRSDTKRPEFLIQKVNKILIFKGRLVQQITVIYDNVTIHARIMKYNKKGFEVETIIPPISIKGPDERGKEIIISIKPSFANKEGIFYTDSNGMAMQKNKFEDTADNSTYAPKNYRPINSALAMRSSDGLHQITILNDRAQGASYIEGELEIMFHRRVHSNDERGIPNTLGEDIPRTLKVTHLIIIENLEEEKAVAQREQERDFFEEALIFYAYYPNSIENLPRITNKNQLNYTWLDDVKFNLFFEGENMLFVRFFNFRDEFDVLSDEQRNPKIDIEQFGKDLWRLVNTEESLKNVSVTEMSLNHLIAKEKEKRNIWPTKTPITEDHTKYHREQSGSSKYIYIYI